MTHGYKNDKLYHEHSVSHRIQTVCRETLATESFFKVQLHFFFKLMYGCRGAKFSLYLFNWAVTVYVNYNKIIFVF